MRLLVVLGHHACDVRYADLGDAGTRADLCDLVSRYGRPAHIVILYKVLIKFIATISSVTVRVINILDVLNLFEMA